MNNRDWFVPDNNNFPGLENNYLGSQKAQNEVPFFLPNFKTGGRGFYSTPDQERVNLFLVVIFTILFVVCSFLVAEKSKKMLRGLERKAKFLLEHRNTFWFFNKESSQTVPENHQYSQASLASPPLHQLLTLTDYSQQSQKKTSVSAKLLKKPKVQKIKPRKIKNPESTSKIISAVTKPITITHLSAKKGIQDLSSLKEKNKKEGTLVVKGKMEENKNNSNSQSAAKKARTIGKKELKEHALELLKFSYSDDAKKTPHIALMEGLAFLYSFHRYNLARLVLLGFVKNENNLFASQYISSKELRRKFVHGPLIQCLNEELILQTQKNLKEFLPKEVAELTQEFTHYYVKSDQEQEELVRLSGFSVNHLTFQSVETTPLYKKLYNHSSSIIFIGKSEIDKCFYDWIVNQFIPLFNLIAEQENHTSKNAAINTLIIIFGEYCHPKIVNYWQRLKKEKLLELPIDESFIKILEEARELRDLAGHEIDTSITAKLEEFKESIKKINDKMAKADEITSSWLSPFAALESEAAHFAPFVDSHQMAKPEMAL